MRQTIVKSLYKTFDNINLAKLDAGDLSANKLELEISYNENLQGKNINIKVFGKDNREILNSDLYLKAKSKTNFIPKLASTDEIGSIQIKSLHAGKYDAWITVISNFPLSHDAEKLKNTLSTVIQSTGKENLSEWTIGYARGYNCLNGGNYGFVMKIPKSDVIQEVVDYYTDNLDLDKMNFIGDKNIISDSNYVFIEHKRLR